MPRSLPDCSQLLCRRESITRQINNARLDLLLEAGDTHHEELRQVRAHDGQELDTFQKRVALIHGLFEDTAEKGKQG